MATLRARAASCASDWALFVEVPLAVLPPSERERFEESDEEADEAVDAEEIVGARDAVSERPSSRPRSYSWILTLSMSSSEPTKDATLIAVRSERGGRPECHR